jgi:hypothetical protein
MDASSNLSDGRGIPTWASLTIVLAVLACGTRSPGPSSAGAVRTRADFARAMSEVRPGTAEAEIRRLLGDPDDVRTEEDPGGIDATGVREIWRYGAATHLGCATLGLVYVGDDGSARYVFGGSDVLPAVTTFDETELRRLLCLLDAVPSYNDGASFNPLPLIRAVNALQPLGKELALTAVAEYLRIASPFEGRGYEGAFLVLRTLFDVPAEAGGPPPMLVGGPSPAEPEDATLVPRYPLLLAGDIPFLLVRGYMLGGEAQPPEQHLAIYREQGTIRTAPLRPADDPLAALEEALQPLAAWSTAACGEPCVPGPSFLANQALLLLDDVLRKEPDVYGERFASSGAVEPRWRALREELGPLGIRWNADTECYSFADGSRLPAEPATNYRRITWSVPREDITAQVVLERRDRRFVHVEIRIETPQPPLPPSLHVTLRRAGDDSSPPLVDTELQGEVSTTMQGSTIELPAGTRVRIEARVGEGDVLRSPEYEP